MCSVATTAALQQCKVSPLLQTLPHYVVTLAGLWPPQYPDVPKRPGMVGKRYYFSHQGHKQAKELRGQASSTNRQLQLSPLQPAVCCHLNVSGASYDPAGGCQHWAGTVF